MLQSSPIAPLPCSSRWSVWAVALIAILVFQAPLAAQPSGFVEEEIGSGWQSPVGATFAADGRMFVWDKAGRVWIVENDQRLPTPLIDLSDEVGNWRDYGMLGFALHPNFLSNGYIYCYYVVDHHHLAEFGTPGYNPFANEYFQASIGRITRYTANASDDFHSVDPASRLILVGESASTGFPIVHQSHGTGSLAFGTDGTLLAACGDAASYETIDNGGGDGGTYSAQALAEGILRPAEDVGAFRAQLVDSLNGKIVRLDPLTGDGVPSNPFYDPLDPRAARSRVWALGLRNPCRITIRPDTGSHDPADADPGSIYIGDVGWNVWEDLHVCDAPGQNFGWPIFEGFDPHLGYIAADVPNLDVPNPLFGTGGCTQEFLTFGELLIQDTLDPNPVFSSSCGPITGVTTFIHTRPAIDWRHGFFGPARVGTYEGLSADTVSLGQPGAPVTGSSFGGNCSIAGAWYTTGSYPASYHNRYFHGDWTAAWLRQFEFDDQDQLVAVETFDSSAGQFIDMTTHPLTGDLHYVRYDNEVIRLIYTGVGNQPPSAVASFDVQYGASPLTVQFTGDASTDPESLPLDYEWDFGDGATSTDANPGHIFTAASSAPESFEVTLTVTDSELQSDSTTLLISVNNTPPVVTITSPLDGTLYPLGPDIEYDLLADLSDAEHEVASLTCSWVTVLHHNDHTHPEPADSQCTTTTVISPIGCVEEDYWYTIELTVTDPEGLSTTAISSLYADCPIFEPFERADVNASGAVDLSDAVATLDYLFNGGPLTCLDAGDVNDDGTVNLADAVRVLEYLFGGAAAPGEPFGACGDDPTDDTLDCEAFSACP